MLQFFKIMTSLEFMCFVHKRKIIRYSHSATPNQPTNLCRGNPQVAKFYNLPTRCSNLNDLLILSVNYATKSEPWKWIPNYPYFSEIAVNFLSRMMACLGKSLNLGEYMEY